MILEMNKLVYLMDIHETKILTNLCDIELLFDTINNAETSKTIYDNYNKQLQKYNIDFVDTNIINNIINAQEHRVLYNINPDITKLFLNHDSIYLHFYINIVKYIYYLFKLNNKFIIKDNYDDDLRITFIHRNIINEILEPFYIHNRKSHPTLRINSLLDKFNIVEIIENNKFYKPFIVTPYKINPYRNSNLNKVELYKIEFNKKIYNNYVYIKDKDVKHTYTKLPSNLYEQIGKSTNNSKEHQLYYSFMVSLIKTNTNNIECVERDENKLKLYLPNSLKLYRRNKIDLKKSIVNILKNVNNINEISSILKNKTNIHLPSEIKKVNNNYKIYYL